MLKINIITQLLMFFILAIIINLLNLKALMAIFSLLLVILMFNRIYQFIGALKRFKWLFLVMMIIFSLNTPGEHFQAWTFSISPTYEGIIAGIIQTLRVAVMLAAISWIMAINTRQQLISGFYFVFSPLKLFGLEVARFSARLWLTLHYVELQRESSHQEDFISRLKHIALFKSKLEVKSKQEAAQESEKQRNEHGTAEFDVVVFELPQFQVVDYVVITLLLILSICKFSLLAFA